jgi:Zn-dependent M28 family amino/carboxypeptidase
MHTPKPFPLRSWPLTAYLILLCASLSQPLAADPLPTPAPSLDLNAVIAKTTHAATASLTVATLKAHLTALAAEEMGGRLPGSPEDKLARAYITETLRSCGIADVQTQPFTDDAGRHTANIIATIPGSDLAAQVIVIGAHHDHLGSESPGANDNASGVAALLAIACATQRAKPSLRRTTTFIAFGAEEPSDDSDTFLAGSSHFVASPLFSPNTLYMINLDMVGSYAADEVVYGLGAASSPHALKTLLAVTPRTLNLDTDSPTQDDNSDFAPFKRKGIPHIFFWTEDEDCYHETCDTLDRIDYDGMLQITQVTTSLLLNLAISDEKP